MAVVKVTSVYSELMAEIYFNKIQQRVMYIGAKTTVVVAGRRTGKTYGMGAPFAYRNMQRMPGSTGGIVVPTFRHGLTNTLPGLFNCWQAMGLVEGIHYVVGKKPPKYYKSAKIEPLEYEHVISFYNGSRAVLISQDIAGSSNSLTLDWLLIDEAKFINFEKLKDETLPANGGIRAHFGKHSFHHSMMIMSDMPVGSKGSWFLNYREKMDMEVIRAIEGCINEEFRMKNRVKELRAAGKPVPDYLKYHLRSNNRTLNQLRAAAVFYIEVSTIENLEVVGVNYIKDMKRDLPPLVFQTSIMCQRLGILQDGFYNSMKESHKYHAADNEWLMSLGYGHTEAEYRKLINSQADKDVNPDKPICIGMDYNANINWIVAGQEDNGRLNVIRSFYVKFERKIPALIGDFCNYYRNHRCKQVIFYYDTTALGSNYAVNKKDFKYVIEEEFKRNGWRIKSVFLGNPMRHADKYLLINRGFAGQERLTPYFNIDANEALLVAIQSAGVIRGAQGFKKHKAGEKLAESEENVLEHRTDGTDAFDTLYIGMNNKPQRTTTFSAFGTA